jgi:hypothetical protein
MEKVNCCFVKNWLSGERCICTMSILSYVNVFLETFCRGVDVQLFKNKFSLLNNLTAHSVTVPNSGRPVGVHVGSAHQTPL